MKREDSTLYRIGTPEHYEGLRALWCKVFGDTPEYVDYFYRSFGEDIEGFVVTGPDGNVVSALTCYKCGTYTGSRALDGKPVYVSYAICTDPEHRGMGLAGELTSYVRDIVISDPGVVFTLADGTQISGKGGVSLVSPAEESLVTFYETLGYTGHFFADYKIAFSDGVFDSAASDEADFSEPEFAEGADVSIWGDDTGDIDGAGVFDPGVSLTPVKADEYNSYREAFLADIPHIALSGEMLEFIKSESLNGDGLYVINCGDAVCMIQSDAEVDGKLYASELLVDPRLLAISGEIDSEIASGIAKHFDTEGLPYRTSGAGKCQSMLAVSEQTAPLGDGGSTCKSEIDSPAYFGFPVD